MSISLTGVVRNKDVVVLYKGDACVAVPSDSLLVSGWKGGQGLMWTEASTDKFVVSISDGRFSSFAYCGSDETGDRFTGLTMNQVYSKHVTVISGSSLISTSTYEKYTWASRQSGSLVQIVYEPNQQLYFSLRGYWTNEDEATLSGSSHAPNSLAGFVTTLPKPINNYYLGVQTAI